MRRGAAAAVTCRALVLGLLPSLAQPAAAEQVSPLCPSGGQSQHFEWATRLQIGDGEFDDPTSRSGYIDTTAAPLVTVEAGHTYQVEIDARTNGTTYHQYFGIWLDLDQDEKIVDPDERVLTIASVPVTTFETVEREITIPDDAFNGVMFGRMMMQYSANPQLCGDYPYGATIDFRVEVPGGQDNSTQQQLTVDAVGNGHVVSSPPGIDTSTGTDTVAFNMGREAELTATPAEGGGFAGWSGDAAGSANPTTVVIGESPMTVTATFTAAQPSFEPLTATATAASTINVETKITDDGGLPITERGFVYGEATGGNPTLDYRKLAIGAGDGTVAATLEGLDPRTAYAVRAFATTAEGTTYSDTATVTTDTQPLSLTNVDAADRDNYSTEKAAVNGWDLEGVLPGFEDVLATDVAAIFDAPAAGQDRTVTVTDAALTGSDADRYDLALDPAPTTTATIRPAEATLAFT